MYEKYLVNDIPKEFLWGGAVTASQTEGGGIVEAREYALLI